MNDRLFHYVSIIVFCRLLRLQKSWTFSFFLLIQHIQLLSTSVSSFNYQFVLFLKILLCNDSEEYICFCNKGEFWPQEFDSSWQTLIYSTGVNPLDVRARIVAASADQSVIGSCVTWFEARCLRCVVSKGNIAKKLGRDLFSIFDHSQVSFFPQNPSVFSS